MIEINLLPEELRVKVRVKQAGSYVDPLDLVKGAFLILAVLLLLNICLAGLSVIKNIQVANLNSKWEKLGPQRKVLDDLNKESSIVTQDAKVIESLSQQRISWPEKLSALSLKLPSGIWFSQLKISQKEFTLQASAISLQKQELNLIRKFMDNLKNDSSFIKDFDKLQLNSVEKKVIGGYEVADFVISGTIK